MTVTAGGIEPCSVPSKPSRQSFRRDEVKRHKKAVNIAPAFPSGGAPLRKGPYRKAGDL